MGRNRDEAETKRREITGYTYFAKSIEGPGWNSSKTSIMSTVEERAADPQWVLVQEVLDIRPRLRVLDCGAGRCWASYLLAKEDCEVVAVDISRDDVTGLRAGRTLIEETGVRFHLVCADLENLPFREEVFDLAFGSQYLHHAYSLSRMLMEIVASVKLGGMLVALNEHVIPIYMRDDRKFRARHPAVASGVNEHAYHFNKYKAAITDAGLECTAGFPYPDWEGYFRQIGVASSRSWLKRLLLRFFGAMHSLGPLSCLSRWIIRSLAMTSFSFFAIKKIDR